MAKIKNQVVQGFLWGLFLLSTFNAAALAYAFHVVSKYPQFVIKLFGPSIAGMNLIRFLRFIAIPSAAVWALSLVALLLVKRALKAKNIQHATLPDETVIEKTEESKSA